MGLAGGFVCVTVWLEKCWLGPGELEVLLFEETLSAGVLGCFFL